MLGCQSLAQGACRNHKNDRPDKCRDEVPVDPQCSDYETGNKRGFRCLPGSIGFKRLDDARS